MGFLSSSAAMSISRRLLVLETALATIKRYKFPHSICEFSIAEFGVKFKLYNYYSVN